MALSDFVPGFGDRNVSNYYRSVLGVPIRKRIVIAVVTVFALLIIFVCGLILAKAESRHASDVFILSPVYVPFRYSMNVSVDPCTNFYEFACGLWSKNDVVSKSNNYRVTTFELLQEFFNSKRRIDFENARVSDNLPRVVNDAIQFFNSCVSQKEISEFDLHYLKSFLNRTLGGWPALDPDSWDGNGFDWIRASAALMKTLSIETITEMYSIMDDKNTSQRVLYLKSPVFEDNSNSDGESTTPEMIYSIVTSLSDCELPPENISDNIGAIMASHNQWKKVFPPPPSKPDRLKLTLSELKEKMPEFDWLFYIQLIMNDTLSELKKDISEQDIIVIEGFDSIKNAIIFFNSGVLSKREMADLFGWLALKKVWFLVPGVFQKYAEMFSYDADEMREGRKSKCFDIVLELYESSVDFLFIKNSSLSCISDGKVLVNYLKESLEKRLSTSDWLDNSTKSAALLKLNAMQSIIGFKQYLVDKAEFDDLYSALPAVTSNILQMYFDIKTYYMSCLVAVLKSYNKLNYVMPRSVTDVSAYYAAQKNVFTLPLSMYNPPFFHEGGPWYLNFGALGSVIGHEIMHGFDKTGCRRGATGNLQEWWTNSSAETYRERADCFLEQYSSYTDIAFRSKYSDRTIDEDIADSEGLHLAYLAYQQWVEDNGSEESYFLFKKPYSPEQMFFISFGSVWCSKIDPNFQFRLLQDRHSLPRWRVNGAISNSKFFSDAFKCPKDSPMNPEKKCAIW